MQPLRVNSYIAGSGHSNFAATGDVADKEDFDKTSVARTKLWLQGPRAIISSIVQRSDLAQCFLWDPMEEALEWDPLCCTKLV